jgi:Icc protein
MSFSFVHITDHHLPESEMQLVHGFSPAYAFRSVIRHVSDNVANDIDFIVTTGDLVESASDAAYRNFGEMLTLRADAGGLSTPRLVSVEGLKDFPMYFLPGNHDDRDYFFRHLFPQTPPRPLMNFTFLHKGIQFIGLDWGAQNKAIVYPETLDFLSRSLQTDLSSVLLMHHHPVPIGSRWLDNFIADDISRFWEIVKGRNVLGIFCGHVHMTYDRVIDGIPVFGLRSTAFPFALQDEPLLCLLTPHYRLVRIENGILTTRILEVPL